MEARKALADCQDRANVEHFHEVRKARQASWMHLGLIHCLWPFAMRTKRADAKRLVDILSHEYDLSVLATVADQEPNRFDNGERLELLLDAIIERQQVLRAEGFELMDEVFSETARTENRIFSLSWRQAANSIEHDTRVSCAVARPLPSFRLKAGMTEVGVLQTTTKHRDYLIKF